MIKVSWCVILMTAISAAALGPAHSQGPERLTAVFQDWTATCALPQSSGDKKICETSQARTIQGHSDVALQVVISLPSKDQPPKLFFQVTPNVSLPAGIKLVYDEKVPGIETTFRWCIQARCLATADLTDAVIKALRARTEDARVEFKDAAEQEISQPVSFKGFGPALDWMQNQ
jgi:invasion protein IalB